MIHDRYSLEFKLYPYARSPDQDAPDPARHPVVVMGGGPIGMALALDLGLHDIPVLVLDDHEGIGKGSRAICFAKRTLEIADRLGCGREMLDKGIVWNIGKVFHDDRQIFEFNLQPEDGHEFPAFINLQQPYFERFLVERIREAQAKGAPIEIRGRNRVTSVNSRTDGVDLEVDTPEGAYKIHADWLIGCDGAGSPLRKMLGEEFHGRVFEDNFLIADIRMMADFPTERWFWFEPHFKSGASALLHRQPDDIWRVDFQIGWDIDRDHELKEENIRARLDAMLGPEIEYEIVWTSIYTFQCRRMTNFRHGRILFAGDAAHQVSPFGARGANSGIQDIDNLAWKLRYVLQGTATEDLLDSYASERESAADENILNSTRATDFITPKSKISRIFRDAVLDLSANYPFARTLVNSGRLSLPTTYDASALNGPDELPNGPEQSRVGSPCPDAPIEEGFLLSQLGGTFTLLAINSDAPDLRQVHGGFPLRCVKVSAPPGTQLAARYLGKNTEAIYLIRPDQHVAARWITFDIEAVENALEICLGKTPT